MAKLTSQQRLAVLAEAMRSLPGPVGVVKSEFAAALAAVDDWVDDNAAAMNSAIPQPARSALSGAQKAQLLMIVVATRFKVG